jgi:hypothetical protein
MTIRSEFLRALLKEGAPIFVASGNAGGSLLTLHVAAGSNIEQLRARIRSALSQTSEKLRVSVRSHKLHRLAFPRSIEHWLRPFSSEGVLYDPTMIVARARELQRTAQSCRATLGKAVDGIFYDPVSRNLLVLVRGGNLAERQAKITKGDVSATARAATSGWDGSIQVVSALPRQRLVPVDAKSAGYMSRLARFIRRWRAPGAVALAISAASALPAAAHTNARHLNLERTTLSVPADAVGHYGVLTGLSVFADGTRLDGSDPFVSSGLKMYFGDKQQFALNTRQAKKKWRRDPCEEVGWRDPACEVGQTGPGAAGAGAAGAGAAGAGGGGAAGGGGPGS